MEHNVFWSVVHNEFLWFQKDGLEIVLGGDLVRFENIRVGDVNEAVGGRLRWK